MSGVNPTRTPDPLAGSRRRALDRLGVLRAMGLGAIGDMGGGGLNQTTTTTVTWETATDWDNASAEGRVTHSADVIELLTLTDDHNDNSLDTTKWADRSVSASNIAEQNGRIEYQYGSGQDDRPYWATADALIPPGGTSIAIEIDIWLTGTNGQEWIIPWWDGQTQGDFSTPVNGIVIDCHGGNVRKTENGSSTSIASWSDSRDTSPTTYKVEVEGDASSFDVVVYKSGSQVASATGQSASFTNDLLYAGAYGRETDDETRTDNPTMWFSEGFLESGTKSFASSTTPDLQNLSYSLNGGAIDLKVIGSPGTASEEILTQTLDGSTGYALSWSSSHTDFRIRPELDSTADYTTPPTFSRGELVG